MKKRKQSLKFDRNTTKFKKFDYGDVIELKDLTIEDCVNLYEHGYEIVIRDGQVVDLKSSNKHLTLTQKCVKIIKALK